LAAANLPSANKAMTIFKSIAACFAVADVGKTLRWYEQHLGFSSHPFPANEPYVFGILERDNVEIMLQRVEGYEKRDLYSQRPGGVWDAYVRVAEVEALCEKIRERVNIKMPLQQQPYGDWEFEVQDLNGYVLVFSELKPA
jgi:uncharacterized glyoxalase superfamily protein PhnB